MKQRETESERERERAREREREKKKTESERGRERERDTESERERERHREREREKQRVSEWVGEWGSEWHTTRTQSDPCSRVLGHRAPWNSCGVSSVIGCSDRGRTHLLSISMTSIIFSVAVKTLPNHPLAQTWPEHATRISQERDDQHQWGHMPWDPWHATFGRWRSSECELEDAELTSCCLFFFACC